MVLILSSFAFSAIALIVLFRLRSNLFVFHLTEKVFGAPLCHKRHKKSFS
jgi:hypothetical protein